MSLTTSAPNTEFKDVPNANPLESEGMPRDHPLSIALFRVMQNVIFEEVPNPELDCLPLAQLRMLWAVFHTGAAPMKDFSEKLGVSQSTATQIADRLVRRGMVERLADQNDRRMVKLRTTESAQRLLKETTNCKQRLLSTIWSKLTEEDQERVVKGLQILGLTAEAINPNPHKGAFPSDSESEPIPMLQKNGSELHQSRPRFDIVSRPLSGKLK